MSCNALPFLPDFWMVKIELIEIFHRGLQMQPGKSTTLDGKRLLKLRRRGVSVCNQLRVGILPFYPNSVRDSILKGRHLDSKF